MRTDWNIFSLFNGLGFSTITVAVLVLLVLLFSSYVRIATVLSIVRIGLGVNSVPSAFVTGGLALTLSFLVMYPTLRRASDAMDAVAKERSGVATDETRTAAIGGALNVWRGFLAQRSDKGEVQRFGEIAVRLDASNKSGTPESLSSLQESWRVLAPAFLVTELKAAFATGLALFLPFLLVDLLIATVMTSVGFENIDSAVVSLPFKLLLFIMVDGWGLITANLVSAYA